MNKNIEKIKKKMNKPSASNSISLVRWGGLSIVRQKGNYGNEGFHTAPERYGFYAFIFPFIDLFLISSTKKAEFDARVRKEFQAIDGLIWTHIKPHDVSMILAIKDNWYKVRVTDLNKIIRKVFAYESSEAQAKFFFENIEKRIPWKSNSGKELKVHRVNPYGGYGGMIDHLEVFVCRDTKISQVHFVRKILVYFPFF